ncbi:phosphate/phosphite/phosphonate ABC transporter substrate-binding protein [Bradyrhizobium diazoefficiens]|nr:phosphate/phosphite/phosphonate ABC transporter substrate-binding protein [Bradyrhizobium diazoefficiens]MBR0774223.1 phosphate/phosphite/phosphonate ABC transporter substrate-binding protein [Bradyrhizobium diazoefficiens]
MARLLRLLLVPLLVAIATLGARADDAVPKRLKIGLLPGESSLTVMRLFEPLRRQLESRLGMPVELQVGTNYAATGEALRFGRIDIAYLGPVTYVLQSEKVELVTFATPSHAKVGALFEAAIIVPADSTAKTLKDLEGTNIAFGDPASTSGSWVPRYELLAAGLREGHDYKAHYLGAHDAVALAVANRKAAAGGISRPVYDRLLSDGKIDPARVRVLMATRPIPEYAWTFRAGLDPAFRQRVAEAFYAVDDPAVLGIFKAERFIPSRDTDMKPVRAWVDELRSERATH